MPTGLDSGLLEMSEPALAAGLPPLAVSSGVREPDTLVAGLPLDSRPSFSTAAHSADSAGNDGCALIGIPTQQGEP